MLAVGFAFLKRFVTTMQKDRSKIQDLAVGVLFTFACNFCKSILNLRRDRFAAAILVLCCAVSYGGEFYVSPAGLDSNPGTKDKPFAALEAARDAARKSEGLDAVGCQKPSWR